MKTYQKPITNITVLETINMIAASNNYGQPEQGQNLGQTETTDQTSGNLSRRRDIWAEEEVEEQY